MAISPTVGMIGADAGWPITHFPDRPLGPISHGQGKIYYVTAWSAVIACVGKHITHAKRACPGDDALDTVQDKVQQMPAAAASSLASAAPMQKCAPPPKLSGRPQRAGSNTPGAVNWRGSLPLLPASP